MNDEEDDTLTNREHLIEKTYEYPDEKFIGTLMLFATISFEICGTLLIKYSQTHKYALLLAYVFYFISLGLFSKTLCFIPLSLAYTTWCTVGAVGVTIFSQILFDEHVSFERWLCILCIIPLVIVMYSIP